MDGEDVAVGFLVLLDRVALVRIGPETAGVHGEQVYGRLAAFHPLGEEAPGAARRRHAEAEALGEPEVPQAVGRADQRVAVGGVGNGAVHHILDAGFAEDRHPGDGRLDMRLEPLQVAGEQLLAEIVRHAVHEAGRRARLIGAEDQPVAFLAEIVGGVALPQHRHLRQPLGMAGRQRRVGVGDDILVLHRDDGHVDPDHRQRLAAPGARRRHDMFGDDLALVRDDPPGAVRLRPDIHNLRVAVDFRAAGAGAGRKRIGQIDRGHMAVMRVEEGAHQALRVRQRPERTNLIEPDHLERHADGVRRAAIFAVLVHAVAIGREPEIAGDVKAHILPGLGFERLVEIDRVFVDLADAVAHVEERQQARRVPGGAGRQFGFFEQHGVGPTELCEMVGDRDADAAAADNHSPGVSAHGWGSFPHRSAEPAASGRRQAFHSRHRICLSRQAVA